EARHAGVGRWHRVLLLVDRPRLRYAMVDARAHGAGHHELARRRLAHVGAARPRVRDRARTRIGPAGAFAPAGAGDRVSCRARLVFRPSPSHGYLWLIAVALAVLAPTLAIVLPGARGPSLITLIAIAPSILIGLPFLALAALFPTMRYELDADALTLRYGPVL